MRGEEDDGTVGGAESVVVTGGGRMMKHDMQDIQMQQASQSVRGAMHMCHIHLAFSACVFRLPHRSFSLITLCGMLA